MTKELQPVVLDASELSLAELRKDCARMTPHWHVPTAAPPPHVPAARIRGLGRIIVPPGSAALLNGMSEYGD